MDNIVSSSLDDILCQCFKINRMLDRASSVLEVKFSLRNTGNFVHQNLAHPIIGENYGDSISSYKSKMNVTTNYKATPSGDEDYEKPVDIFVKYRDMLNELIDLSYDAMEDAKSAGDYITKKFVNNFAYKVSDLLSTSNTLIDIFEPCGTDMFKLILIDSEIEDLLEK